MNVPPVLLSGNHEVVRLWRRKQALINTLNKRSDMLDSADLSEEDIKLMKVIKEETTI